MMRTLILICLLPFYLVGAFPFYPADQTADSTEPQRPSQSKLTLFQQDFHQEQVKTTQPSPSRAAIIKGRASIPITKSDLNANESQLQSKKAPTRGSLVQKNGPRSASDIAKVSSVIKSGHSTSDSSFDTSCSAFCFLK
ncbi:hypothetical protein BY996DRAFT_1851709 [Phakopsora pachyrhizi]|nr:hypothetical protein BY996DRAFT_1851709 [Phakopsora pachyrhizi]